MNHLNSLIIEGDVSRELVMHNDGLPNADFEIAVKKQYRNRRGDYEETVSYFTVVCFGNVAEVCKDRVKLERGVRIVGNLKMENWKDNDGKSYSKVVILAEHIEFKPVRKGGK